MARRATQKRPGLRTIRSTTPGSEATGGGRARDPAVDTAQRYRVGWPGFTGWWRGKPVRIRRGRATVTRERGPFGESRPLGRPGKAAVPARSPGSQETRLRPARQTPSAKRGASVRISLRVSLAVACAAGLAAAPAALAVDTTIRVEGASANLIPESAIPIEGSGTAQVFDKNFAPVDVSRASAF